MYLVTMIIDGEAIDTKHSHHPLAATLRFAYASLVRIPQAEMCIRKDGHLWAWLHTNHRGVVDEIEIHPPHTCRVSAINPQWSRFQPETVQ